MMTTAIALDPVDFPLSGTGLIEASAGTGKTYTIAALYLRLILGHNPASEQQERYLLPPDILVVTFTEAATKELRERIRERLSCAARFFRQQIMAEGIDPFLEAIRAHYAEQHWPSCARRLELAANWMDESAIYTIHGWCNRMLQQHAFDSGSLFHQEVNTHDSELLNQVVRDYWRSFYYQFSYDDPDFQALYKIFKQPDDLFRAIKGLLTNSDPIAECLLKAQDIKAILSAVDSSRKTALQTLKQPWQQWATEIKSLLDTAVENKVLPARNYNSANRQKWIDKIIFWSISPDQENLVIGKGFENLSTEGMAKLAKLGQIPPKHPGFDALGKLPGQLASLADLKVELLKHAIHWIRNRYSSEKQRIARMTFDDMLTRLDKALQESNGPHLVKIIREQYPIALIDEFQDTDPVQYRIFSTLYPANIGSKFGCFMIGDPKQAIYSFRGADIYTYLKAHQNTAGKHYTLGTNYRSSQAFVNAVNQLFQYADQQINGAFRFKQKHDNPLPFNPVAAQGRGDEWVINNQTAPALSLWHWQTTEVVGLPEYREKMAETTASEIVRLLNLANSGNTGFKSAEIKSLQLSDIAILVRTRNEAKVMRKALAKRQLRSVYLSERDSVFASCEASDLLLWLKALADPGNERKVRTALSTSIIGWSYQKLHQLAVDDIAFEQQLERFMRYRELWQQQGILPALWQFFNDYDIQDQLITDSDGERCITNLLHLAELLQQASTQLEGEQALIRYFAEAIADDNNPLGDEAIVRLESDARLIKIITIHKSKGLEYPLVFLPFICSFKEVASRSSSHYRYHDHNQDLHIDLHKKEEIRALSDEERLQEDIRLIYVAMTRAQYACWLGIAAVKSGNSKACQLEKSGMGSLLGWQTGMTATDMALQLKQIKGNCQAITLLELPKPSLDSYIPPRQTTQYEKPRTATTKIATNWWIASYSALQIEDLQSHTTLEPETAQDDKQTDEAEPDIKQVGDVLDGVHGLPRGAEPGVLIHELLEQCAQLGFATVQANADLAKELIQQHFTSAEWINKQDIVASALSHWLTMPLLKDSNFNLSQLSENNYQAELEFLIGADRVDTQQLDQLVTQSIFPGHSRPPALPGQINGLLKGFIDLVFMHKQQYYIVDYKFNSLGQNDSAYTEKTLLTTMLSKRYDLQYSLYLLALHRLLQSRLGEQYDYDQHIGGGLYLFLRGSQGAETGRVFGKPAKQFMLSLDKLFSSSSKNG